MVEWVITEFIVFNLANVTIYFSQAQYEKDSELNTPVGHGKLCSCCSTGKCERELYCEQKSSYVFQNNRYVLMKTNCVV